MFVEVCRSPKLNIDKCEVMVSSREEGLKCDTIGASVRVKIIRVYFE